MFEAVFQAVKRVVDMTLIPALLATLFYLLEAAMGAVSWVMLLVGDLVVNLMGWALSWVDIPEVSLDDSTFGAMALDLASIAGLWPAIAVYFGFALAALVVRVVTFKFLGDQ